MRKTIGYAGTTGQSERKRRRYEVTFFDRIDGITFIATLAVAILSVILLTVMGVYHLTVVEYEFRNEVHSHFELAYRATSLDHMLEELELAEQGMRNLGLTEDMYCTLWGFQKTPDNQMSNVYRRMAELQTRIRQAIQRENNGSMTDGVMDINMMNHERDPIYETFRGEITASGIERKAKDAYYTNGHKILYFGFVIYLVLFLSFVFCAALALMVFVNESNVHILLAENEAEAKKHIRHDQEGAPIFIIRVKKKE